MTSVVQPVPPPAFQNAHAQQAPAMSRSDSMATADMHIPGAWVGTNPGTPAPIGDDMQYLGEQLKQLPTTVQGYFPSKEATSQTISDLKDKTAAAIPASVMNTAANVLPTSLQPTAAPTAADAQPPVPTSAGGNPPITTTTNTTEHKSPEIQNDADMSTTSTFKDKAAAILPAGALSAAAAYLPSALNPTASPTAADAQPSSTTAQPEGQAPEDVAKPEATKEEASESTWAEKILPAGTLAAAGAYLPTTLNPFGKSEEPAPTPFGEHEGLNNPLPPVPTETGPLIGSTLSPDEDVQEALSNAADPEQYKVEVVPPANGPDDTSRDQSIIESTRAIGGATPLSPTPKPEYTSQDHKAAEGLGALGVAGAGALAVDHGLKDQKETAVGQNAGANGSRLLETNESFQHVVTPATPFAEDAVMGGTGNNNTGGTMSKLDTNKKHRRDRSGSVSAGEASPSSPSKGGMFSGIRKLTKKREKGHSRDTSIDDGGVVAAPPSHENSLDTQNSNSTGSGGSPTKRERNVLHKDPPAHHDQQNETTTYENEGANANTNANAGGGATPSMLSNPFSPISPSASSPTKVGFKDKIKGEFMSVSGTIKRDHGLKEAGEKLKKGTL